jgi:hypothetical protein
MHGVGSRNKLMPSHARYYPGDGVLDVAGRAICEVHCLPRKELHEAFETATRISAFARRGGRVVDLCCGYGLVAQLLLIIDPRFTHAVAVDRRLPKNHVAVHQALLAAFPRLSDRMTFVTSDLHAVSVDHDDTLVSAHACGPLTDAVCSRATEVNAAVSVLPCCHQWRRRDDLRGHPDPASAMDHERAELLRSRGYHVVIDAIGANVTQKNRLLHARPQA